MKLLFIPFLISILFLGIFGWSFVLEAEAQTKTISRTKTFGPVGSGANCRFVVTRKGNSNSQSTTYGVNRKIRPFASRRNSRRRGTSVSTLMVSPGLRGSIEVDGVFAQVKCIRTARAMIVEVFAGRDDGKNVNSISTSITVSPGQKINIGSVVRDLRNKSNELSTSKGIRFDDVEAKSAEEVFLQVQ